MAFCSNCGAQVDGRFCGSCGKPLDAPSSFGAGPTVQAGTLDDNIASVLCYLLTFITGILFLVIAPYNERPAVRFHAMQAIFFGIAWFASGMIISIVSIGAGIFIAGIAAFLHFLVWIVFVVLWIVLMVKAYQGVKWKLPILGDLAEKQS